MRTFNPNGGIYTAPDDIIAEINNEYLVTAPMPADVGRVALSCNTLQFIITRKCDSPKGCCGHCMRDRPEPIDMTTDMVDEFFARNRIVHVHQVLFGGGNPPLNGKIVPYIAQKFREYGIPFDFSNAVINPHTYSQDLVDGLKDMKKMATSWNPSNRSYITISKALHGSGDPRVRKQYKKSGVPLRRPQFNMQMDDILPLGRAVTSGLLAEYYGTSNDEMRAEREKLLCGAKKRILPVREWIIDGQPAIIMPEFTNIEPNGSMNVMPYGEWHELDRMALCDFTTESITSALYRQGLVKQNRFKRADD